MAGKFLMPHTHGSLYVTADVAKFEPAVEKDLIDRKIAEKHAPKKPAGQAAA